MVKVALLVCRVSHSYSARIRSHLIAQFVRNVWIESYDPTIEDSYTKEINVDVWDSRGSHYSIRSDCIQGRRVQLEILDTAGTEQFSKSQLEYWSRTRILIDL